MNKKIKRVLTVILSVILAVSSFSAVPVFADEITTEMKVNKTVQKSINKTEAVTRRIALGPIASVSTYAELVDAVEAKTPNIYILQDISLDDALQIDYNVSFLADDTGVTLMPASGKRHIQITASDVQIQFNNVILDGGYGRSIRSGGIEADGVANISLINPVIQNCYYNIGKAAAIYGALGDDDENGFFYIYNGIIKNNYGKSIVELYSTDIIIYNSIIENNDSPKTTSRGTLVLAGNELTDTTAIYNSTIRNNSNTYGAGINIAYSKLILNKNTIIENNTAKNYAGGIYAEDAIIESYGKINNNTAGQYGGGIALYNSQFIMHDGEVSYNTSKSNGGGISIINNPDDIDNVIVNDGVMQGNVSENGSAIGYDLLKNYQEINQPRVIINDGTFCNNGYTFNEEGNLSVVCKEGGAIYGSDVIVNGGTFEKNICTVFGGAIFTLNLTMTDGMIQDNGFYEDEEGNVSVHAFRGGGLYIYENADITGGLIYSNQAEDGAGITAFGTLSISAPAYVRYNTAEKSGGGVYFFGEKSIKNVDFSRIKNNTAETGAQYFIS